MTCPREIAEILLAIIRTGLLQIRSLGWENNPERCAIEADHLHNIPDLLVSFSPALLKHYWEVERVCFQKQSSPDELALFGDLWNRLAPLVQDRQVA